MSHAAYNSVVAARTRAAQAIKSTPSLLAALVAQGGLESDLDAIITSGLEAEAHDLAQSGANAGGIGATAEALAAFEALQREYKAVMAIVEAVRGDLSAAGAAPEVLATIDRILADETAVHVRTVKGKDGASVRRAVRTVSQEAVRAEIRKDAAALLAFEAGAERLARRTVDAARLQRLLDAADALAHKVANVVVKKGERKAHNKAEIEAVRAQRQKWSSIYRILRAIDDPRMRGLLKDARG